MKIGDKELRITPSSFDEAMDLKDAIFESIRSGKLTIDLEDADSLSLSSISPETIGNLINTVLGIDCSKRVRDCLFVCAERAMLGSDKIDRNFFSKQENQEYYYQIMFEIIRVNITPFFKGLFSKLSGLGLMEKIKSTLKQK